MYMIKQPLLFKYRSADKGISFEQYMRLTDIIVNHRLYLSSRNGLNDLLEGVGTEINLDGYAGQSITKASNEEDSVLSMIRDEFRIVSLSGDCFSPLMWAHYGGVFQGMCFCFKRDNQFMEAKRVKYISRKPSEQPKDNSRLSDLKKARSIIKNDFFRKKIEWKYEKEWRILKRFDGADGSEFFKFDKDLLVAVIFGHGMDTTLKNEIKRVLPDGVKQYKTHIGKRSYNIELLDEDYTVPYNGSELRSISSMDRLYQDLLSSSNIKE